MAGRVPCRRPTGPRPTADYRGGWWDPRGTGQLKGPGRLPPHYRGVLARADQPHRGAGELVDSPP